MSADSNGRSVMPMSRLARGVVLGGAGVLGLIRFFGVIAFQVQGGATPASIPLDADRVIEAFDPSKEVLLWVGRDGQPGQANLDDNANGVVDDTGELGAVHSDDQLVTPSDASYAEATRLASSRVMFRGAFVADSAMDGRSSTAVESGMHRTKTTFRDAAGNWRVWYPVDAAE